ncbi:hypothetical protein ACFLUH_02725 [Chloroflexota bacterium]
MNEDELRILEELDIVVHRGPIREQIDSIALRVERKLTEQHTDVMIWGTVPLTIYRRQLPAMICSSWIFAIHNPATTGAERHPNSIQRMMSYRGSGNIQVWNSERWCSNHLNSSPEALLENRWMSIPENVWHQAVVAKENWVVLSFHTVLEDELIEERPDSTNVELIQQRRYMDV